MKKKLLVLFCLVWGYCFFPASGFAALKIGVLPASDSLALHVAHDEGLFKEKGLDVELVPFQSALEQSAAIRAGALHGWFTDMIMMLLAHESGAPQCIVATMCYSGPGSRFFGVAAAPGSSIEKPEDLKGAKIAVSRSTIIEYMLDNMLEREGGDRTYAELVDIRQISVRLQLLLANKVDAAVLPEPLLSLVEAKGARVVMDNSRLSMPLAITAMRRDAIAPDEIRAFQEALGEAMRRVNEEPEKYRGIMIGKGLLPKDASQTYRMLSYPPDHTPLPLPTVEEIQHAAGWMLRTNLLRKLPAVWDMAHAPGD